MSTCKRNFRVRKERIIVQERQKGASEKDRTERSDARRFSVRGVFRRTGEGTVRAGGDLSPCGDSSRSGGGTIFRNEVFIPCLIRRICYNKYVAQTCGTGKESMQFALAAAEAAFNTADIVALSILGLGVLAGIFSGFARMLEGWLGVLIAVAVSVVLAIVFAGKVSTIGFMQTLHGKIEDGLLKLSAGLDNFARMTGKHIEISSGGEWVALTDLYAKGLPNKAALIAQGVLIALCSKNLDGTRTIGDLCAGFITDVVSGAMIFVVGVIVLMIIFNVLASMLEKVISKQKSLRAMDRFVGMIFGTLVCALLVAATVFLIEKAAKPGSEVMEMVDNGTITGWLAKLLK